MNTMTEEKTELDDALVMVHLRNNFYHRKYHFMLGIYLLTLIANIVLVGVIVFLVKHPTRPAYFATNSVGELIPYIPLDRPNMSIQDLSAWTVDAVEAAYTYNYLNYRSQLQDAQKYFTEYGWRNYMKGLEASNNLVALNERKLIVIANVVDQPKLVKEGILNGSYACKFTMRVLVTYFLPPYSNDPKYRFSNSLNVTVTVQRQNLLQSYKGLGILQIIGALA